LKQAPKLIQHLLSMAGTSIWKISVDVKHNFKKYGGFAGIESFYLKFNERYGKIIKSQ